MFVMSKPWICSPAPRLTKQSLNGLQFFENVKNGVSFLQHLGTLTETQTFQGLPTITSHHFFQLLLLFFPSCTFNNTVRALIGVFTEYAAVHGL